MAAPKASHLLPLPNSFPRKHLSRSSAPGLLDIAASGLARDIQRIAPTRATVLIMGETGTGKELVARRIHELSAVPGPFIAVNCGSLSEQLIEAELFGHEAGAFTGAAQARAGWFEAAHGGTFFLDEIGDLPMAAQVKLLRVLQERQVVRIGSRKPLPVDVRLIAATHVDLAAAVEARQFRHDLYYRLNVATIRLLPLRERRTQILPLAQHFIELYRQQLGLGEIALSASTQRALLAHSWPGNIRELENTIHRALIVTEHGVLEPSALGGDVLSGNVPGGAAEAGANDTLALLAEALRQLLASGQQSVFESAERLLVSTAFEHCGGNQVRTARRLGISRNILRALLKRHGLLGTDLRPGSVSGP